MFFGGKPLKLLELLLKNEIESFVSEEIVSEYQEIFNGMLKKYHLKQTEITLPKIISKCKMIQPSRKVTVCRDPDDNKFLECATEAKCLYVVSGDNDLLDLKQFEDVEIITVAQFFERLEDLKKE